MRLQPAPHPHSPDTAAAAVIGAARQAPGISLDEVLAQASLQVRLDRKYLLSARDFARLAIRLSGELKALDIDGRRSFAYESRYFDTPARQTYREHLAERRDRFKVRIRSYVDSGETMFEVKLKTPDGGTDKRRFPHPTGARERLTTRSRMHLCSALTEAGRRAPHDLGPSCATDYQRSTFVANDGSTRMTCDHDLVCSNADGSVSALRDHVLVEVKSAAASSFVDLALAELCIEEVKMSKYCVGIALLHPDLPSDPWNAVLGRYFGSPGRLAAA